jgi:hypothetical protein
MPFSRKRNDVDIDDYEDYEDEERPPRLRKRRQPPPPRRHGCLGTLALLNSCSQWAVLLIFGGVILVVVLLAVRFVRDPIDNVLGLFGFERNSTPVVVDSRTIVLGIQKMAVLQTASGDIQITKTVVDTSAAPDAELRVSYIGHVTAGIDLSRVGEQDIVAGPDGRLTVTLPPAQLTGCYLGKPDIVSWSCTGIPLLQSCTKINERLQDEAYKRAIEELSQTASDLKLLDLANQEAESRIYNLLTSLGYPQVSFNRSTEILPPNDSCLSN